jgi:hypothetical protein
MCAISKLVRVSSGININLEEAIAITITVMVITIVVIGSRNGVSVAFLLTVKWAPSLPTTLMRDKMKP